VGGIALLRRSIDALLAEPGIGHIQPVIGTGHAGLYAALGITDSRVLPPVEGGSSRQASVLAGLVALGSRRPDLVLIQDAARPFVDRPVIAGVLDALKSHEAAL